MELLKVITLDSAREKLINHINKIERDVERVDLLEARGRILAENICAPADVPGFRRSTVDGYALVAADTHGCSDSIPVFLKCIGSVAMGEDTALKVGRGQCVYVPTGGMLPEGADAMVMVEYCEQVDLTTVAVGSPVAAGASVVLPGDDMKAGQLVMGVGRCLEPQDLGALAALGFSRVPVYRKYKVSVISLGDELMAPGEPDAPAEPVKSERPTESVESRVSSSSCRGKVFDSNGYAVAALAEKAGMEVVRRILVADREEELRQALETACKDSDFVVTSGGSSKGRKDMSAQLIDEISKGGIYAHGIALKPGKPTILAWNEESATTFVGLPGHPAAAFTVFKLLVAHCVSKPDEKYQVNAILKTNIAAAPGRQTVVPVKLVTEADQVYAQPVYGASGLWSLITEADGFIMTDLNSEGLRPGERVVVRPY